MAGNSKPLRWEDPIFGLGSFWAMEIPTCGSEATARAKLIEDLGEVDDRFIHVFASRQRPELSYIVVLREETSGMKSPVGPEAFF